MGVLLQRKRRDYTVISLLHQEGRMHISALAAAAYGKACRRNEHRVMRTVARLRQKGWEIFYDKRRRVYMLAEIKGQ